MAGLKYLLLLLLISGCGLFESDGKENVDDVHFSCTIVHCGYYQSYFPPSYDTTGLNLQFCSLESYNHITASEQYIQMLDTVIVHHAGNTADATDLCYRKYLPYQNTAYPGYLSPDSCFCEAGIVF